MISNNKKRTPTQSMNLVNELPRRALAVCCLLLVVSNVPNTSLAQDARYHYQLMQDVASQQQLGQTAYSLADPSDASLLMADLFNSFGGGSSPSELATRPHQERAKPVEGPNQREQTPGHYEFEVAPKMEPPGAPKPPFKQASNSCPGSDLFGGFSPRHTLCGDLYQGRVPLNPMGQLVNDQAYPFELIKNKTLQFLARSLPILKTEYETIPKVARYLPAHQLLNPTHRQSLLGHQHLHQLNQLINGHDQTLAPPFLQRRKKRSTPSSGAVSVVVPSDADSNSNAISRQQAASITVAELMSNASLVVSSAHSSSAGRIGQGHPYSGSMPHRHHLSRSADAQQPFTMITKDGHRPFGAPTTTPRTNGQPQQKLLSSTDELHNIHKVQQSINRGASGKLSALSPSNGHHSQPTGSHVSPLGQQIGSDGQDGDTTARQSHHASGSEDQKQQLQARSSADSQQDAGLSSSGNGGQSSLAHRSGAQAPSSSSSVSGHQQRLVGASGRQQTSSSSQQQQQQHLKCSSVNGLLMYTVCQAASALIEGDSAPGWLQAAKQIGSLYAATSSADNYSSATANANPMWSLWNALSPAVVDRSSSGDLHSTSSSEVAYKSSNGSSHHQRGSLSSPIASVASVINLLNPLMGLFAPSLQRASDLPASPISKAAGDYNSSRQHHNQRPASGLSSNLRTLSNVLLTGLSLAGLYDWFGASSSSALFTPMVTTFARRKKPYDPSETFVDTPASLAAMASAKQLAPGITQQQQPMGQAPTSKQPPTPCPSVEEYISPTFARNYQGAWKYVVQIPHEGYFTQTIQRSSCVRQKCEFTEGVCHEAPRWVSLLVAEIYYPHAIFGASAAPGQQQQQSTDMLNQRVAFDGSQQQQLNQLMATAPSTSQIQQVAFASAMASGLQGQPHQAKSLSSANHHQDPMQMTDSLNNYSHNLNSAFNLALELGLNPMNVAQMEQLASVHNQQLMQRNGLAQTNQHRQQAQAESRVGTSAHPTQQRITSNNQVTKLATNNNQQQQQQQQYTQTVAQMPHLDQNQVLSNDYIRALAFEAIRQNPNLSIDELIKSIETQSAVGARRRKRDLTGVASNQQQQHSQSMSALQYSQRLPSPMAQQQPIESLASLNELGGLAAGAAHMSQQHAYEFGLSSPASPMQAPQQQQQQPQQTNRFQPQQPQVSNQINANNQQQIRSSQVDHQQMLASQSTLAHEVATAANQQAQQQHVASNPQAQQQSADPITQTSASQTSGNGNQASVAADNQVECDGHDKIGCYVVRVYYDWFLVNGSCKCWKTSTAANQQAAQGGSSSSSSSSASGSFIRRIFTG